MRGAAEMVEVSPVEQPKMSALRFCGMCQSPWTLRLFPVALASATIQNGQSMGKHYRDAVLCAVFRCTDIEDASYSCRAGGLNPYGDLPLVLPIVRGGRKDVGTPITKSSPYNRGKI